MKIGIETSALSTKFTGTGRYISCLIEQLETTGHYIKFFSAAADNNGDGVAKKILSLSKEGVQRHLYRQFFLSKEMRKEQIECGIFPNYFMPAQFKKHSIIIIHDISFLTHPQFYSKPFVKYYSYQIKETLKQEPVIVTVSENSREQIHKQLGIKKEKIFLVQAYSKFQRGLIGPNTTPINRQYLLYVGHVEPRKNLQFLIENFLLWKKERKIDIGLIIAGEIWIKSSSINNLLSKYNNHPDIKFTGYVGENELLNLYSNAAGFVHTSIVEGFGFPVLEAMHYNLPIICSQSTATEEISSPGSVPINPYDNFSFKKGLDRLYSMILSNKETLYNIIYSPMNMNNQLNVVLDIIECRSNFHVHSYIKNAGDTEEAVEKTLLYASLFNSGIRRVDLLRSIFDIKTSESKLNLTINSLISRNIISIWNNSLYLNTAGKDFYKRKKSNRKLRQSLLFLKFLKTFPTVSVIAFSGGTAHYGLEDHDDIDLFIITKPNCIYPVYACIHLFSFILGLRKVICANYLIDENNIEIDTPKDFYTAHQLISLVPYKNSSGLKRFIFRNNWINYFFPNFEISSYNYKPVSKFYNIFIPLNVLFLSFYKNLYKDKITGDKAKSLKLTSNCLKLHTNDNKPRITSMFEKEWNLYCEKKNYFKPYKAIHESHREVLNSGLTAKTKVKFPA